MESIAENDSPVASYLNISTFDNHLQVPPPSTNITVTDWITCNDSTQAKQSYNCESRPYMTVLLVISVLILLFVRRSSIIRNWVSSNQAKLSLENPADEEEGLMQRVF